MTATSTAIAAVVPTASKVKEITQSLFYTKNNNDIHPHRIQEAKSELHTQVQGLLGMPRCSHGRACLRLGSFHDLRDMTLLETLNS